MTTTPQETSERLPDLSRYDRFGFDTETTGVTWRDRPVGLSLSTPDDREWYLSWAHEGGGNNCTVEEVRAWAAVEMTRPKQLKIAFNGPFDLRQLAYDTPGNHGVPGAGIAVAGPLEDGGVVAPVLNENEDFYNLNHLLKKYCKMEKDDTYLNEWCAAQFGGKPWRQAQAQNYWRVPRQVIDEYAKHDARGHRILFETLRPRIDAEGLGAIYAVETALIPILTRMHLLGVRADVGRAIGVKADFQRQLEIATAKWEEIAPGVNPLSGDQIAPVFEAHGLKVAKTEKGNWSITKEHLEAWAERPVAALIQEIRESSKYAGTFVESYILSNVDEAGSIHGEFHQLPNDRYGTVSGRFSSGGALNLQNLPGDKHPELMRIIRGLFVPWEPGQSWWKFDYSQIEYRFLAHYAGGMLADRYNEDPDVDFHQMLADMINNPVCNRRRTKNVNFAVIYGAGLKKAAATAGITEEEMAEVLEIYHRETRGQIKAIADRARKVAGKRGYIKTWGGRRRRFRTAEWARAKGWRVYRGESFVETHKALNALLQGSAADLIKMAMVKVAGEVVDWKNTHLHLTVHDELDLSGPHPESADGVKFASRMREAMEDYKLSVPIRVDVSAGPSWGDTRKLTREGVWLPKKERPAAVPVLVELATNPDTIALKDAA